MKTEYTHSWEQAVEWLRLQPDKQDMVRHCYYDDPLEAAAERFFRSEEWRAVSELLGSALSGRVLDLGAGRGISSYAFARSGCAVTALEPYPSSTVGSKAILGLAEASGLSIDVVEAAGEEMPFDDESFDVVYCRAALHHARDLGRLCAEATRVLRTGGTFLATREHVLSKKSDLPAFLSAHSLHFLYGGECAYTLAEYKSAIEHAGLRLWRLLGPYDSVVNHAPMTSEGRRSKVAAVLATRAGARLGDRLASFPPLSSSSLAIFPIARTRPGVTTLFLPESTDVRRLQSEELQFIDVSLYRLNTVAPIPIQISWRVGLQGGAQKHARDESGAV